MKKEEYRSFRTILMVTLITSLLLSACVSENKPLTQESSEEKDKPNIILLFVDDMGYADLSSFGGKTATPQIDKMADEGMKFTDFYVPASSCSPSRNALLTGCYPARNYVSPNMPNNAIQNLTYMKDIQEDEVAPIDWDFIQETLKTKPEARLARHTWGIPSPELTMAEMLKEVGYKTVMYGKWHLGEYEQHHPTKHGFDEYFGATQSASVRAPHDNGLWMVENDVFFPNQPFYENDSIIAYQEDYALFTKRYTSKAIDYIKTNKDAPFFMYMSYTTPHIPLGVSEEFKDKSGQGLYADVVQEIDWSVGEILHELKSQGLDKNTLVVFTSDNGPWLAYGEHAGSAAPLREGKNTHFEGGVRVPTIFWWPETIPATISNTPAMTIDLLPTVAELTESQLPKHKIDGKSIWKLLQDGSYSSSNDTYYFFDVNNLPFYRGILGVRRGKWKYIFPHKYKTAEKTKLGVGGQMVYLPSDSIPTSLFDLSVDKEEHHNVINEYPEIAEELKSLGLSYEKEILENQRDVEYIVYE